MKKLILVIVLIIGIGLFFLKSATNKTPDYIEAINKDVLRCSADMVENGVLMCD